VDGVVTPDYSRWTPDVFRAWVVGVEVLRSVARRVKRVPTRPYKIKDAAANTVFAEYFGLVTRSPDFYPVPAESRWEMSVLENVSDRVGKGPMGVVREFWTRVLYTFLKAVPDGVCSNCHAPLPRTPTGRVCRQKTCNRCRQRLWSKALSPDQRNQRKRIEIAKKKGKTKTKTKRRT
jgi:hypothetical protein